MVCDDIAVVRYLADRIAMRYLDRIMEVGLPDAVVAGAHHPYTQALLSAVPELDGAAGERIRLEGEIPSAVDPPSGCVFHTRCRRSIGRLCEMEEPPLARLVDEHLIRCHLPPAELDRQNPAASAKV